MKQIHRLGPAILPDQVTQFGQGALFGTHSGLAPHRDQFVRGQQIITSGHLGGCLRLSLSPGLRNPDTGEILKSRLRRHEPSPWQMFQVYI
jgi:hypothetical protein